MRVGAMHPGGVITEFQELAGQRVRPFALKTMLTPAELAEAVYPAIMRGRRVIVPGFISKLAVLIGKVLPFPWAIRVMELIYHLNVEKIPPTYPPAEWNEYGATTGRHGKGGQP